MSYRYAAAPGYLSPYPTMAAACPPTHEDINSDHYRESQETRSYHSRSSYAWSVHSADTRPVDSYDTKSVNSTFDAGSVYSPRARSATGAMTAYTLDVHPTCSYETYSTRSVGRESIYSTHSTRSTDAKPARSTGGHSKRSTSGHSTRSRSKSRARAEPEPQQFLTVQGAPVYYRSPSAAGSHRSHVAPSLTHSAASTWSEDDNEPDSGRPVAGLSTPHTAKVALWRDDVYDLCNSVPPETILPPHIKARYEHEKRQQEASPSLSGNDIPKIVVPSCSPPSRTPSLRNASPPYPLSNSPSAPASDLERIVDDIEAIDYEVNSRILKFTFPSSLDVGEKLPNGEFPPLNYTSRNKPLIEHRHYLDKTLLRMDEIQSFNDSRVKVTRKRVVTKIQEQLEQLNRMEKMVRDNIHYERWKKAPRIQVTAPLATT